MEKFQFELTLEEEDSEGPEKEGEGHGYFGSTKTLCVIDPENRDSLGETGVDTATEDKSPTDT